MTPTEIVDYYKSLLIAQYSNKGNALGTIDALVAEVVASSITEHVTAAFDITAAVGSQLDMLATYRGISRTVYGLDVTRDYFSFPGYADVDTWDQLGFGTYDDDPQIDGYFLTYEGAQQAVYQLSDDELRRFIQFKALVCSCDYSLEALDAIFFRMFGLSVHITDNLNMTMTYEHFVGDPDNLFAVLVQTNSLPHPAGVGVVVV